MALVDPLGHAYPEVHAPVHVAAVSAVLEPYSPAGHSPLQAGVVRAAEAPKVPSGQSAHTPAPLSLYLPGGHCTAVALVDPAGHEYPAVQLPLHWVVFNPLVAPNLPAGHEALQSGFVLPAVSP